MTLQASGAITLQQISAAYGGPSTNINLQMFYAGGSYVPAGTTNGVGTPIPTSGAISLEIFYGASNLTFTGGNWSNGSTNPGGSSNCTITFEVNGTVAQTSSANGSFSGSSTWVSGPDATSNIGASYQIFVNAPTGTLGTPTCSVSYGVWTTMSSPVTFHTAAAVNNDVEGTWSGQIRNATTGVVVLSFVLQLTSDNT